MSRVLVIDDAREFRDMLGVMLGRHGLEVLVAASADEGLGLARRRSPDVILLDLEMPGRDGVSCLEALRADPATARIPVLMVSATPVRDVILRIARIGVQGVLVKDERLVAEVTSRVRRLLAHADAPSVPTAPSARRAIREPAARAAAAASEPAPHGAATAVIAPSPPDPEPASTEPHPSSPPSDEEDRESMRVSVLQLEGEPLDIQRASTELKALKPLMSRAALLERVEHADVRALKPAAQQVLRLTSTSTASIDSIAKAIKQDQALSLRVLKVANSPLYTRGERIDTVNKAVSRIGVAQIRSTILGLQLIDRFGTVDLANRVKADWFWEHSIACGMIASKIAAHRKCGTDQIDALFTAGLLHDVGRVIYAERLGDEYAGVIDVADHLEMPLETVESRLLLINHADLMDRLLREWNFSIETLNPIALHHLGVSNIRSLAPRMAESIATLALANRLAHALLLGSSGNEVVYPIEEFIEFLSIPRDFVQKLCTAVPDEALDLRIQMLSMSADPSAAFIDEVRALIPKPIHPIVVDLEPACDPIRILADRLMPGDACATPNLAIVRVVNPSQRVPLMTRLRDAESEAGVKNLPTLVVGSGAGCLFTQGALGDRRIEQAIIPARLTRLIRMMNSLANPG
ncbi:MAG: HDOD domain-containing protein [Phycisphaerales bacterium]